MLKYNWWYETKIVKPIKSLLEGIIQSEIKDHLISKIASEISDLFKLCKSEYLLTKYLIKKYAVVCDSYP